LLVACNSALQHSLETSGSHNLRPIPS